MAGRRADFLTAFAALQTSEQLAQAARWKRFFYHSALCRAIDKHTLHLHFYLRFLAALARVFRRMSASATCSFTSVDVVGVGASRPVRAGNFVRATSAKSPQIISKGSPEELTGNPHLLKSLRKIHATFNCQLTVTALGCLGSLAWSIHELLEFYGASAALKSALTAAHRHIAMPKKFHELQRFGECAKQTFSLNQLLEVDRVAFEARVSNTRTAPHSRKGNHA